MGPKKVLVIGNIFESTSMLVNRFCDRDEEVIANSISSRISGAAIVVSSIAAFLGMDTTFISKANLNQNTSNIVSKMSSIGVDITLLDASSAANNTLITIYDSNQDRKSYSFLPAQIEVKDVINLDYSNFDAVFFCCLPYSVVSSVFELNKTINYTCSIILASGLTPEYFSNGILRTCAKYVFCNRGELLNVLGRREEQGDDHFEELIEYLTLGTTTLVVTMGKDGVIVSQNGTTIRLSVPSVNGIIHPGGAGDAFATGYIYGLLSEKNVSQCCSLGHQCSVKMLSVRNVLDFIENELRR